MKKYSVIESLTGVLELTDQNNQTKIYYPNYNLDEAQQLLYRFYEIKNIDSMKIKDSFCFQGNDWFPTSISLLYWQYFYQYIKYKLLIDEYIKGEVHFTFKSSGRFKKIINLFDEYMGVKKNYFHKFIHNFYFFFIQIRNKNIVKKNGDILFYRYGINDFRTNEIFNNLSNKFEITQIVNITTKDLLKYFFNEKIYFFSNNSFSNSFNTKITKKSPLVFHVALHYVKQIISMQMYAYKSHSKIIKNLNYSLFFGIDDTNFVYPLIFSAKDNNIKTLGIQHAAYTKRHESYIMRGIKKHNWYANVIVWGDYWKKFILKNSELYSDDFHIIGSNKHSYHRKMLPKKEKNKIILIPYEFLADTRAIGQYIKIFLQSGFKVFFKVRPDDSLHKQLKAYFLEEFEDELNIIHTLNPEVMAEIDIIAGTQTTLLYDLIHYNKPIWILETSFKFLQDLVDDGFARLIKISDMPNILKIFKHDLKNKRYINSKQFNGEVPITQIIEKYIEGQF